MYIISYVPVCVSVSPSIHGTHLPYIQINKPHLHIMHLHVPPPSSCVNDE